MKCHGCNGRGWVDSEHKGPTVCPICNGVGDRKLKDGEKTSYDQDYIWKKLAETPGVRFDELVDKLPYDKEKEARRFIIHLLLDKDVTPRGNLLLEQIMSRGQSRQYAQEDLRALGYSITSDGKVQLEEGVPVGPVYNKLLSWASGRGKLTIDPNRKGNPLFIDHNMIAVEMVFSDDISIKSSMTDLQAEIHPAVIVNMSLYHLV